MKIKKFLKIRWIIVYSITLVFFSAGYLFLNTQKGLDLAIKLGQQWLPGTLKIKKLNGCLLGPIHLEDLYYKDFDTELSIASAQFDWHWSALLHGQLNLAPLSIDTLILSVKAKKQVTAAGKLSSGYKNFEGSSNTVKNSSIKLIFNILKHIHLDSIDVKKSLISYNNNVVSLDGALHGQWLFNWQLTIPQLAKLIPESKGQLVFKGKISGERLSPKLYFSFPKTNLSWQDWQLEQVEGNFQTNVKNKIWIFELKSTQLKNKIFAINPIHLYLSGGIQPFSLQANLSNFKLNRKIANNIINLDIPSSKLVTKLTPLGLDTTFATNPNVADQLNASVLLPHYKGMTWINSNQTIKGNIQLTLKKLNYLTGFLPILKNTQGSLDTQLTLVGPIFSPLMNVALNLQKASTQIPSLGLNLNNINLKFFTNKKVLYGSGQIDSGKGSLTFQSKTLLDNINFYSFIDLKGNNVEIIHTPKYKIIAAPTLQIQADTHHVEVNGLISFPKARIKLKESNANLVELSNDVVFVNHKKNTSLPFTYKNTIRLNLGSDIRFSYQGLSTKVTGTLDVNQLSGHPILATGELLITEGEYTYYGQSLKLQPHSLLNFANSPIDNPNLDVTANKSVWVLPSKSNVDNDKVTSKLGSTSFISSALQTAQPIRATVGVHLRGYLEKPQITLYADPSSAIGSQLEILSYLVTGQPSSQLSTASLQLLFNAAAHVGGKDTGFSHFINTAQKKIGIDQLTIGANPIFNPNTNKLQQNTSVIIGKNFSPRLNVSYSLGLLDPINVLQINYLLNDYFSLQSTTSNFANGIDLLYKLERN